MSKTNNCYTSSYQKQKIFKRSSLKKLDQKMRLCNQAYNPIIQKTPRWFGKKKEKVTLEKAKKEKV